MPPKIRQGLYSFGVLVFSVLTILSTLKMIEPGMAANISAAVTSLLGVFGVTVAGTAAVNINKQRHDGTLEGPQVVAVDPAEQVVSGLNAVLEAQRQAQQQVDKVREAVTVAVSDVPVLGPLAKEALDRIRF